jgi:hypothetical protein
MGWHPSTPVLQPERLRARFGLIGGMNTNTRLQPRQPRGVPTGGQWREKARPQGSVTLGEEPEDLYKSMSQLREQALPPRSSPPATTTKSAAEAPEGAPRKWSARGIGPVQAKRVVQAINGLASEGKAYVERTGVIGAETREHVIYAFSAPVRPEVAEAQKRIGERFGWEVTPDNYKQIIAAHEQALAECRAARQVVDKRVTPEEHQARLAAIAERDRLARERREREEALMAEVRAKAPPGAEAVVVAELQEDTSDPMTDYFANKTVRSVAIGYRFGKREDFAQLRHVAASFPETAHLAAKETERRDNYSMGAGNYLSDHGSANSGSGWVVRSYPLRGAGTPRLTEVRIPDRPVAPAPTTTAGHGATIRPSSMGREGFVEVVFAERPSQETLAALKAHGFRWARGNRCWYGRDEAFAQALVAAD